MRSFNSYLLYFYSILTKLVLCDASYTSGNLKPCRNASFRKFEENVGNSREISLKLTYFHICI